MAINSSSPLSGAAALAAKTSAGGEAKGKLPAFGPGTPVYPPERLPAQPRGGGMPANTPAAAAADALQLQTAVRSAAAQPALTAPAAADPRGALPEGIPLAAVEAARPTQDGAAGPLTGEGAKPAASAPVSRPRPKLAEPTQLPALISLQAQLPLGASAPAEPAPAASAESAASAAASAPIDAGASLPLALAQPAAAAAAGMPSFRPTGGAASSEAEISDDPPGTGTLAAGATDPALLQATGPGRPVPAKATTISTDTQSAIEPRQHSADVSTDNTDSPPDLGLLGLNISSAHMASAPAASAPPPVQTPVGSAGWAEEVGTHVVWMAHQGVSSASLRLQPEHLGPLEVKISLHDSTASVWFGATEPETRNALQAALPQLKDMFAAQGMALTDAGVFREPPRDTPLPRPSSQAASPAESTVLESSGRGQPRRGLIDTYA